MEGTSAWAERWDGSKAGEEQPEQKVITDDYGQKRGEESSDGSIHRLAGRRGRSFSAALAGGWLSFRRTWGWKSSSLTPNGFPG